MKCTMIFSLRVSCLVDASKFQALFPELLFRRGIEGLRSVSSQEVSMICWHEFSFGNFVKVDASFPFKLFGHRCPYLSCCALCRVLHRFAHIGVPIDVDEVGDEARDVGEDPPRVDAESANALGRVSAVEFVGEMDVGEFGLSVCGLGVIFGALEVEVIEIDFAVPMRAR